MLDQDAIQYFKQYFSRRLPQYDWDFLREQVFCQFLVNNWQEITRSKGQFLEKFVESLSMRDMAVVAGFLGKSPRGAVLIAGDELGFVRSRYSKAHILCYSEESAQDAKEANHSTVYLLKDFTPQQGCYDRIVLLGFMDELKRRSLVQEIGLYLRRLLEALSPKGRLLVSDRILYQDDFVCQFVALGAEVDTLSRNGQDDFSLIIAP
ncbi:MAG: hypothetical protein H3C47_05090 [Candidatus Cloacimonetes bacterium]|nr:hypothetical protein [Candidatus Cloacimonadota bacterium]